MTKGYKGFPRGICSEFFVPFFCDFRFKMVCKNLSFRISSPQGWLVCSSLGVGFKHHH